ncbi:hypothetical protein BB561_000087 [Smittium simulii]|uniref:Uncharacterized protein n=1 Tax=Smittium simulii TaxID=133385 RepID=A0A2T9Z0S8_9FUNG|nr:hypothetical protein BB561_000087 [Smittium simulii]
MNKIFVLSALISVIAAQSVVTESIDSKIIDEIRNEYSDFIPAANAAIADIVANDNVTAEATKKALDGQINVPTSYNEEIVKSLLIAAPKILQYPAILGIIDTKTTEETPNDDELSFTLEEPDSSLPDDELSFTLEEPDSSLPDDELSFTLEEPDSSLPDDELSFTLEEPDSSLPDDDSTNPKNSSVENYNSESENTPKYNKKKPKNSKARRIDPRTLYKIRDNYKNFIKAANAAIGDILFKKSYVAKALKKELNGRTTVPRRYNEATIKAILIAAPQILEYSAVR